MSSPGHFPQVAPSLPRSRTPGAPLDASGGAQERSWADPKCFSQSEERFQHHVHPRGLNSSDETRVDPRDLGQRFLS